MESSVQQRIKELIKETGLTQKEFAEKNGVTYTNLNSFLTGTSKSITYDLFKGIAMNFPQYNINYILTGQGNIKLEQIQYLGSSKGENRASESAEMYKSGESEVNYLRDQNTKLIDIMKLVLEKFDTKK